ncbi:hypothetical protein CP49_25840 [Bradyrhizobium valentinum]|uniref:Uncharacterized protein n=1 Tax=Bradyrhizobium valentinum TaxID=1518501 RepID=A0A0R3M382_9BRAD|nr:hypothetical protein CP49_25840 [Bradyrhizobium valentinum]
MSHFPNPLIMLVFMAFKPNRNRLIKPKGYGLQKASLREAAWRVGFGKMAQSVKSAGKRIGGAGRPGNKPPGPGGRSR